MKEVSVLIFDKCLTSICILNYVLRCVVFLGWNKMSENLIDNVLVEMSSYFSNFLEMCFLKADNNNNNNNNNTIISNSMFTCCIETVQFAYLNYVNWMSFIIGTLVEPTESCQNSTYNFKF